MEQCPPFPQKLPRIELMISEDRRANDKNEIVFVQFTGKRGYAGREYTSEVRMPCRKRTTPGGGCNPHRKILLFRQQDRI
jgi:hypothetical protein